MTKRPTTTPPVPKDPLLEEVGSRIRAERRRRGLTQYDLADRAGTKQSTISAAEVGDADVRLLTLAKLAHAMGLTVADFLPPSTSAGGKEELARAARELAEIARRVGEAAREAEAKTALLQKWGAGPLEGAGGDQRGGARE